MIHTSIPTIHHPTTLYSHNQLCVDNYRFLNVGRGEINSHHSNDLVEKNRLQTQHYISKYIWKNKNFYSPIENKLNQGEFRVLEIGHGSGTWLIDMATEFPNSTFVGVDLTNPILENENKPDNVGFLRCDVINDGIPFPDNTFDFIYQNLNIFSFLTESQCPELIEDMIRVIKPGAWIELMEGSYEFENVGPVTRVLINSTIAYLKENGIKPKAISNIKNYLQTSENFSTDIHTEEINVPLFGGTLGAFTFNYFKTYHKNIRINEFMGLDKNKFEEMLNLISQEVENYKTSVKCFRLYAKKKDETVNYQFF